MRQEVQGVVLVVSAACVFALVAVVVKTDPLPVLMATELRFLVSWVVAVMFMLFYRAERQLHWFGPAGSRKWVLLKSFLSFCFILCWWTGLRGAPVGNCIAIIYTCPILTSILSKLLLEEDLGPNFVWQVALVSVGSLMILEPPFLRRDERSEGQYLWVFLALVFSAVLPLVTKQTRDCSWIEVEHVSAFVACVVDPVLMGSQWLVFQQKPLPGAGLVEVKEAFIIILAATGAFIGIAMETKGYQLAPVGKASMFRYIEVPFGYFLQLIFTRERVKWQAMVGSALVVASCFLGVEAVAEDSSRSLSASGGSQLRSAASEMSVKRSGSGSVD